MSSYACVHVLHNFWKGKFSWEQIGATKGLVYGIFDSLISIFLRLQGVTCRRCFEQGCVQVSDVKRFLALINRLQVKKKAFKCMCHLSNLLLRHDAYCMMHYTVGSAINAETRGANSQSDFENFVMIMIYNTCIVQENNNIILKPFSVNKIVIKSQNSFAALPWRWYR